MAGRQQRVLTDHDQIREWAEERDASPACVRGTGGGEDVGMIRLDFPGYSGETSLEHIEWDEWLDKFDQNNLALLVEDTTARGQKSNFNKIISRETAAGMESGARKRGSARRASGAKKAASSRKRTATAKKSSAKKSSAKKSSAKSAKKPAPRKASSAKKSTSSRTARGSTRKTASRSRGR